MSELRDILIRPILTEKSSGEDIMGQNTYVFQVGLSANKKQIKDAVEQFFDVKVNKIRTLITRGKIKRTGRFMGKRSNWKKAYVTLNDGYELDFYGEE